MSTAQLETIGERPLRLRMRPDLQVLALGRTGRRYWRIKDPVAQRYFELREQEYFLFRQLDGRASAEQICRLANERFAPCELKPAQLMGFVARLHREGLLLA